MKRMDGWTGKYADVDLTDGSVEIKECDPDVLWHYIGGRGLGVYLLQNSMHFNPFDADIPLFIGGGPLCATGCPAANNITMVFRSPLTMTIFSSSSSGKCASELKKAGFDFIIIRGRAPSLSLIRVKDGDVKVETCENLRGMGTGDVMKTLSFTCKEKPAIMCIGSAGENLVKFANVITGMDSCFGRGGGGAVWGSKNLKAIVISGSKKVSVANGELLHKTIQQIRRLLGASPLLNGMGGFRENGTLALVDLLNARRMMPAKNFRETYFDKASLFSPFSVCSLFNLKRASCISCNVGCLRFYNDDDGDYQFPRFCTISHFSSLNDNVDLLSILESYRLCNEMGLDTISTGATISCFGEYQERFIKGKELVSLIHQIAMRCSKDGESLAEGSARWAAEHKCSYLSMTVKGLELPPLDPRGAYGMALEMAVSSKGGCLSRVLSAGHEIFRRPVATDRFSFNGKARIVKIEEDICAVLDSLVVCKFPFWGAMSLEEYAEVARAVTGADYDSDLLLKIGEEIVKMEKVINCQNGFSMSDDTLPERFFKEAGSSGNNVEIRSISKEDFDNALKKYYRIRGVPWK